MVKTKLAGFKNAVPEPRIRRSRRKKVIERWAKGNVWLWICAEDLGLVESPPAKVPVEVEQKQPGKGYNGYRYPENLDEATDFEDSYSQENELGLNGEDKHSSNFSSFQSDSSDSDDGVVCEEDVPMELDTCEENMAIQSRECSQVVASSPGTSRARDFIDGNDDLMGSGVDDSFSDTSGSRNDELDSDEFPGDNDTSPDFEPGIKPVVVETSRVGKKRRGHRVKRRTRRPPPPPPPPATRKSLRTSKPRDRDAMVDFTPDRAEKSKKKMEKEVKIKKEATLEKIEDDSASSKNESDSASFKNENDPASFKNESDLASPKNDSDSISCKNDSDSMKKKRDPLNYVDKSYKGINKIELQQQLYEESLSRCNTVEGRVTRRVVKEIIGDNQETQTVKKEATAKKCDSVVAALKFHKGQIVWGNCQGWWPALVIDPEEVGMVITEPGCLWVFWIGENQITQLNAQTQIQPFSENLESRLINQLNNQKSNPKYGACCAVIELFRTKFPSPLTKPFGKWAEKHIATLKNLDELRYFPYPEKINKKLTELKDINAPKTAKYLLKKEKQQNERTPSPIQYVPDAKDPVTNEPKEVAQGFVPLIDQKIGIFVWAKMIGHNWWPAVIVDFKDAGMREPKFGNQWIMWYGDFTMSEVSHSTLWSFTHGLNELKECVEKSKKQFYVEAITRASKDFCKRYDQETDDWTMTNVYDWLSLKDDLDEKTLPSIGPEVENGKYPKIIWEKLCHRKITCTVSGPREDTIRSSEALRKVKKGELSINDLCLGCLDENSESGMEHPFFDGKMCKECTDDYVPTIFSFGEDGKCYHCSLCGGSGVVAMCSTPDCPLVFCTACLKYLIAPEFYKDLMAQDPWNCFFCEDNSKQMERGLVKPRPDSEERSRSLFHATHNETFTPSLNPDGSKRKIQVLSLFDGISTGLLALEKVGFDINFYIASEIDPDAIKVSQMNYPFNIRRLDDVRDITEEVLKEMGPIDLLIGGSPCNDLSIANPHRKGLNDATGTGILFYEYLRIKNTLETLYKDHHLFWLFENVASMPAIYRNTISECFGQDPDIIDSAQFSAMHRPRLYWNNLPAGLASSSSPDLQDMLDPHCGRSALVKKIRTVTTCSNSLREGKRHSLKPIMMNGQYDVLRVSELERIFGFPRHFTDANLSQTKRLKVLGRAWSVPTICAMLQPLCNFFKTKNDQ